MSAPEGALLGVFSPCELDEAMGQNEEGFGQNE
jgi:hypothetical protein